MHVIDTCTVHICGWSGGLKQSPTAHSFRTYINNFQKRAQDTSFLTFLVYWVLTNCFAEYEQRTLYCALVVTLAMLLRLINCRFIIIFIIITCIGETYSDANDWTRVEPMHFGCVYIVEQHSSTRSTRSTLSSESIARSTKSAQLARLAT